MVVLIGAGMGEDDLITLKAQRYLQKADVVVYDRLIDMRLLLYCRPDAKFVRAGKASTDGGKQQQDINNTLVELGHQYDLVARLHGGDPLVFGRGGEELEALLEAGIATEIIPGVSSVYAAASYVGVPVTHREYNSSFHVYTAHKKTDKAELNYEEMAKLEGTLVFVMGSKSIGKIATELIRYGKNPQTPMAVVYSAGTPKQKAIFGDLFHAQEIMDREKLHSPLVILIGDGINDKHTWFQKPSYNLLFVGSSQSISRFEQLSENHNFRTLPVPILKTKSIPNTLTNDDIQRYHTILFVSPSSVRYAMKNLPSHFWTKVQFGAIGSSTAQELSKHGIIADFITNQGSDELLRQAVSRTTKEQKILICSSNNSVIDVSRLSHEFDRDIELLACYEATKIPWAKEPLRDVLAMSSCVVFTSGLGVRYFFENLQDQEFNDATVFALGQTAQEELQKHGIKAIMPQDPNYRSLLECIEETINVSEI